MDNEGEVCDRRGGGWWEWWGWWWCTFMPEIPGDPGGPGKPGGPCSERVDTEMRLQTYKNTQEHTQDHLHIYTLTHVTYKEFMFSMIQK